MCSYTKEVNVYLETYIHESNKYNDLSSAQQACSRAGHACGGITLERGQDYSLRAGIVSRRSGSGEITWKKGACKDEEYHVLDQTFMPI